MHFGSEAAKGHSNGGMQAVVFSVLSGVDHIGSFMDDLRRKIDQHRRAGQPWKHSISASVRLNNSGTLSASTVF